jgi:hypothetical protein
MFLLGRQMSGYFMAIPTVARSIAADKLIQPEKALIIELA